MTTFAIVGVSCFAPGEGLYESGLHGGETKDQRRQLAAAFDSRLAVLISSHTHLLWITRPGYADPSNIATGQGFRPDP